MSIVMTGGGTGGHLAIVRAVKEELAGSTGRLALSAEAEGDNKQVSASSTLNAQPSTLVYIGSTQGQDRQWFEDDDDFAARYFLETKGVVNQRGLGKLSSLWMMFRAFRTARQYLQKHNAKVVFSVGGFSAAPTAMAAKSLGIPLVIHEQNAALGSLNKLLRPVADAFISSYIPQSPVHAYPIKQVYFDNARVRKQVKKVIFLGGSQGAVAINTLALELAPTLKERGIGIIHQAGERNIEATRAAYEELGIEAEVFGFTTHLADYMAQADLAIARAGASTLWELSATALPTLYIPYPYAAADHQYHNARFLVEKDLAWLMREDAIDREEILSLLERDLSTISQGLMETIEPGGAEQIAEILVGYSG